MKRVVVAVDGSEASREVIDYAVHYANREKDAEMLFLHVVGTIMERGRQFVEASGFAEAPLIGEEVKAGVENFVREQIARSGRTPGSSCRAPRVALPSTVSVSAWIWAAVHPEVLNTA